ncbi:O-methyltransferase [Gilliamella apis]|uniref:O-methyltransferase n=1 Tax=Gilliamella apis TaxID=1970738 RepID=UPI000D788FCC|nr:O-methyltransferase [Gilliamella apis]PXY90757.1 hypothetical protein DKK77_10710 [Gilliamella apis]WLS96568.1 hypothetical protein RAM03_01500 [Gilliamella apis]
MANSGRKINYSIRPAKNIERKMFRDILLRLSTCFSFYDYQYIGFGSKYFVDFVLMHRFLHINDMISIENDVHNRNRYKFNSPYSCIDIRFGNASDVLPQINLDRKSIVWLDYDSRFSKNILGDISTLASSLPLDSIVCLTYNSQAYKRDELLKNDQNNQHLYKDKFIELFGEENIPAAFDERGWSNNEIFSKFIRKTIVNQINKDLSTRKLAGENNILKQILYFDYSDGSFMSSLAFIICSTELESKVSTCNLEAFPFYKTNDESYRIEAPNLTTKEIRYLSEKMPAEINDIDFSQTGLSESDVNNFCKNYKYYPTFSEIEIF